MGDWNEFDDELERETWRARFVSSDAPDYPPQVSKVYVVESPDCDFVAHFDNCIDCGCSHTSDAADTPFEAVAKTVWSHDCKVLEIVPSDGLFAHEQVAAERERCAGHAREERLEAEMRQALGNGRDAARALGAALAAHRIEQKINSGVEAG